jgi:hypothetical protein
VRYPIVNGNAFGPASAEVDLRGKTYLGIPTLNFADELQQEDADGNGSVAVGKVVGKYIATCDFEMLLHESKLFFADLGPGYGTVPFNIGCTFTEQPGAGITTVEIIGATVMKRESGYSKGANAIVDKITVKVIVPIRRDGLTIVDVARAGASIGAAAGVAIAGISTG